MRVHFLDGAVEERRVGDAMVGRAIERVELDTRDVLAENFEGWFMASVVTRFVPR